LPVSKYNLQLIPGDLQVAYNLIGLTTAFGAKLIKNPR
jgi:hypothetical protein